MKPVLRKLFDEWKDDPDKWWLIPSPKKGYPSKRKDVGDLSFATLRGRWYDNGSREDELDWVFPIDKSPYKVYPPRGDSQS